MHRCQESSAITMETETFQPGPWHAGIEAPPYIPPGKPPRRLPGQSEVQTPRLHNQVAHRMTCSRNRGTIRISITRGIAYSGKTDSGYGCKQCILKKSTYHIEKHKYVLYQNIPACISIIPAHSPTERHPVRITASVRRLKKHT